VSVGGYWQPKYSVPNARMVEAVQMLARTEGILLDPVYTGKIMAGLIGLARQGRFKPGENVLFLHTGGLPSLHAYEDLAICVLGESARPSLVACTRPRNSSGLRR
jgi:D-cysteine desulfhydrase